MKCEGAECHQAQRPQASPSASPPPIPPPTCIRTLTHPTARTPTQTIYLHCYPYLPGPAGCLLPSRHPYSRIIPSQPIEPRLLAALVAPGSFDQTRRPAFAASTKAVSVWRPQQPARVGAGVERGTYSSISRAVAASVSAKTQGDRTPKLCV